MDFPSQVNLSEMQRRVRRLIREAKMACLQPYPYMLLPSIIESLEYIDRSLNEEKADLATIERYAFSVGYSVVLDGDMSFIDTHIGQAIGELTGDIIEMRHTQNAFAMIKIIMAEPNALPVSDEIYVIIADMLVSFASDGRKNYNYLVEMKDKLREIRKCYGTALGPDYQQIFQEIMG